MAKPDVSVLEPAGSSRDWNFHPSVPIGLSPVFDVPPRPKASVLWFANTWLRATPPVNHLMFAVVSYVVLWPSLHTMSTLSWSWIARVLAVHLVAVSLVGGILHYFLYVFAGQGMRMKYDVRPMERRSVFTFGYQVWDNMFWTFVSGVPIWTAWTVGYFALAANDHLPVIETVASSPVWFVVMFVLVRFWQSFHFYWIHRAIHTPWLFKKVHHLHHRNVNVGPWSGLSMHPVEHLLYYSSILIHFVVPSHPIHVLYHMFALNLGALISHAGFDMLIVKERGVVKTGSFFHQLHHRYFECNYGSEEVPLDRWFGSFHDGTDAATRRIRARKRLIFAPK